MLEVAEGEEVEEEMETRVCHDHVIPHSDSNAVMYFDKSSNSYGQIELNTSINYAIRAAKNVESIIVLWAKPISLICSYRISRLPLSNQSKKTHCLVPHPRLPASHLLADAQIPTNQI